MSGGAGTGAAAKARALFRSFGERAKGKLVAIPSKASVQTAVKKYEAFTGVVEVRDLHRNVVSAQVAILLQSIQMII